MTPRAQGIAALFAVQVFFGLFPLLVKLAGGPQGDGFSARSIASWRMLVGAVVLFSFACLRHRRRVLPEARDLPRLALCALLGVVLNQILALEGIVRSTVVNAGLLMTLIPVFTYAMALLVRQERFRRGRALGIAVAMAGAVLLVLRTRDGAGGEDFAAGHLLGNVLIVANCLSYSAYLLVARPLLRRYPPTVVIAWVFLLTWWTLPLVARGQDLAPAGAGRAEVLSMVLILLFPTTLAYLLNTYALARVSATTTAVFIYLQPLVAGATGVAVLGERVGVEALVASALLFAGIGLVVLPKDRKPLAAPLPRQG